MTAEDVMAQTVSFTLDIVINIFRRFNCISDGDAIPTLGHRELGAFADDYHSFCVTNNLAPDVPLDDHLVRTFNIYFRKLEAARKDASHSIKHGTPTTYAGQLLIAPTTSERAPTALPAQNPASHPSITALGDSPDHPIAVSSDKAPADDRSWFVAGKSGDVSFAEAAQACKN